ncbi:MAG TPA: c-type cytochrome [Candidatus Eisenbacteria bacterium]
MSPAAWLPLATALTRVRFPQTTTEPASAWMRAARVLLERQSPWVVLAFVVVQGLLLVSVLRLRRRVDAGPTPPPAPTAPGSRPASPLGMLWTLAPWLLVGLVALPALEAALRPPGVPAEALRVNVIGHQWWWEIKYPDSGIVTATDVHVPVGRPVRFVLESADVAHSLWLPAVSPRVDIPPLRRRELSFTPDRVGVFPGQCAELCGASHAHMHLELFVDTPAAFAAWVAAQRAPRAEPPDSVYGGDIWQGEQLFVTHACRGCHTVRGLTDGPAGPDLTHFASRTTIGSGMFQRSDSSLSHWLLDASALKEGSSMPGFPLPERDMKQLVAWLQSLR